MDKRTSHTATIRVNSLAYSSIFEIGDANQCTPVTRAIAVQKEGGVQSEAGFHFDKYDIFERPPREMISDVTVHQHTVHHNPHIYVNNVDVTAVSASSVVQIGSLNEIDAEARIKHIRILKEEDED